MRYLTRRDVVVAAGAAAPALLMPRIARAAAAAFPARSIQFIIPYGAGGGFDTFVRYVSPVMEQHLPNKVSIVPFNIATGGGMRGITQLYRSRPDGHTIGIFDMPGMFVQQAVHGANGYDMDEVQLDRLHGRRRALSRRRGHELAAEDFRRSEGAVGAASGQVRGDRDRRHGDGRLHHRDRASGHKAAIDHRLSRFERIHRRCHPRRFRCGDLRHVDDDEIRARQSDPHPRLVRDEVEHSGHSRRDRARQAGARCDQCRAADRRAAGIAGGDPEHPVRRAGESLGGTQGRSPGRRTTTSRCCRRHRSRRWNWSHDSALSSTSGGICSSPARGAFHGEHHAA